jgi:hypothetical protein
MSAGPGIVSVLFNESISSIYANRSAETILGSANKSVCATSISPNAR